MGVGQTQESTGQGIGEEEVVETDEIDDDETEGPAPQQSVGGAGRPVGTGESDHRQGRPVEIPAVGVDGIQQRIRTPDPGRRFSVAVGRGEVFDGEGQLWMAPASGQLRQMAPEGVEIGSQSVVARGVE